MKSYTFLSDLVVFTIAQQTSEVEILKSIWDMLIHESLVRKLTYFLSITVNIQVLVFLRVFGRARESEVLMRSVTLKRLPAL